MVSHERHRTCRGFFGDTKGVASDPYAFAHSPPGKRARNNRKKAKTSKFTVVNKVVKTRKRGNNRKIVKTNGNKRKKDRARRIVRSKIYHKPKSSKEADRTSKKLCHTGTFVTKKPATNKRAKLQ